MGEKSKGEYGEGNYHASQRYREGASQHAESGDVKPAAKKAREALEGEQRRELQQAEERGKAPARE